MKPEKISDDDIGTIAAEFLRTALGTPDSDIGRTRLRNLEAYNAEPVGDFAPPEIMDRADFVATDVADTVDGMLPQILKMFVAGSDAVEAKPRKQGGEKQAKDATAYLNHIFYVRNDGLSILYDWFHDALLQKVGFVQVWAEEDSDDGAQRYSGITPEMVPMILQDGGEIAGDPEQAEDGTLSFTVKREGKRMCFKVAAIAPHEMRIDPNARWGGEPAIIGREYVQRMYELQQDGYDMEDVGQATEYGANAEARELLGDTDDYTTADFHSSHMQYDKADIYMKLDRDGDGVVEWLRVGLIGGKLALKSGKPDIEQVDDHPYCDICPKPRPHAYFGDCPADRAYEPQRQRTYLIRGLLDSAALSVNGRTYVNMSAKVNIDDLLDSRPGGIIRGEGDAGSAIQPIMQPSMGGETWQLNEWMESWRESRTSFNRYSAGTDSNALNKTKGGVEILTNRADMGMELMARFFAQGVRKMFAKLLKLVTQHQNQQEWFAVNDDWINVLPTEWRDQFNLEINVGLGQGTKEQQAARIMAMIPLQQMGQAVGVVRPEHVANTIRLFAQANEFKSPDQFADAQPSGMPPNPQAFQQMQQQNQEQMAKMQEEMQKMAEENQQLKMKAQQAEMDAFVKDAEMELHQIEMKKQQATHEMDAEAVRTEVEAMEQEPERMVAESGQMTAEAMLQASEALIVAAQAIAAAQGPRVVQIQGANGVVYTGTSEPAGVMNAY